MTASFASARSKLLRAKQHIDQLDAEIEGFHATHPDEFGKEFNPKSGKLVLRLLKIADAPDDWALLIGDAVHNLASALDHIVWELADPRLRERKKTEFPIYKSAEDYRMFDGKKKIAALSEADRTIVLHYQPYCAQDEPTRHPLWLIHELDTIDKHRTLHLTKRSVLKSGLGINTLVGFDIYDLNVYGATEPGAVLAECRLVRTTANPQLQMQPQLTIQIEFGEGSGAATGGEVVATLRNLHAYVSDDVLPEFDRSGPVPISPR